MQGYHGVRIIILLFCGFCQGSEIETTTLFSDEVSDVTEFPLISDSVEKVTIEPSVANDGYGKNITTVQTSMNRRTSTGPSTQVTENVFTLGNSKDVHNVVPTDERKEITIEDLSNDLLGWKPPQYIRDGFPMYISGFDYDDQPIWILEMGKYDIYSVLRRGQTASKDFEKFVARNAKIAVNSLSWKNPRGYKLTSILDFEGLKLRYYAQFESVAFLLKLLHDYRRLLEENIDRVVIINVDYPAHALINLWRPVIGRIMEVVDIYGNDKTKWIPHLLRVFPQESLPEWYGGFKNFTPYRVI